MTGHRWSGWPGAWCLDCGAEDEREICVAVHNASLMCVLGHWCCFAHDPLPCSVHYNRSCPCPGEALADPYQLNEKRRELIYLLVRRLGDVLDQQECPASYFGLDLEDDP